MSVLNYRPFRLFPLLVLGIFLFSDNSILFSQRMVALDVYRWTGAKRYRFYEKDKMSFRILGNRRPGTHTLVRIGDSTLLFDNGQEVKLKDIDRVAITRFRLVSKTLSTFLIDVGAGIIVLDAFNNSINKETPVLKEHIIKEGIVLMAAGGLLRTLHVRRYRINDRRTLKILDLTP